MIPPTSPPPQPRRRDPSLDRPRPDARRVLWISLSLSAVLHVVAIVLYAVFVARLRPEPPAPGPAAVPPEPRGTEVVRLVVVPDETAPPEEEEPEPLPEEPRPDPRPRTPGEAGPAPAEGREEAERTPSAAELLRPRSEGDPRLWRPIDPALLELSAAEIAELRAAGRLAAWADSVAAVREAERRALDWTYTDDEGRRWGISPEGIHLGDVTLPAPSFGTKHADAARRQYEWGEIERGAADAQARYYQDDRARAIRERRNREREQAKADTTGGGGRR